MTEELIRKIKQGEDARGALDHHCAEVSRLVTRLKTLGFVVSGPNTTEGVESVDTDRGYGPVMAPFFHLSFDVFLRLTDRPTPMTQDDRAYHTITVRIPIQDHKRACIAAAIKGSSVNEYVSRLVAEDAERTCDEWVELQKESREGGGKEE